MENLPRLQKKLFQTIINKQLIIQKSYGSLLVIAFLWVSFTGCQGGVQRTDINSTDSGTLYVSADESFKPVIDSQIQVFEALNPDANIIVEYKPEAECFKDLLTDSTRMIFVTRGLTIEEERYYEKSISFMPKWSKIAYGAIAVIVNNDAPDSVFTMNELRGILEGNTGDKQLAVFGGLKGSSTFRFFQDSILKENSFDSSRVFGVEGSLAVIDYVKEHKNVIGFVGVNWIGNKEDTMQLSFLNEVNIASLECKCPENTFVKPYQANIMRKRYPLVRGLYYILKENYAGLGSGFANFLESEKGQLIFRRAYLGPAKLNFYIRSATLNSE